MKMIVAITKDEVMKQIVGVANPRVKEQLK